MKERIQKIVRIAIYLALVCFAVCAQAEFTDACDTYNTSLWTKADGWTNGAPFNCWWTADSINFSNSQMVMSINPYSGSVPYKAAEYRSNAVYQYGFFEARMKASNKSGTVTGLVLYTGPAHGTIWDEIDIEILGNKPTQMQCNFFGNSTGGHEIMVNLGFDSSADFHNYGWEWQPGFIKWYVDGKLVYTYNNNGTFPVTPSMYILTLWNTIGVDSWTGAFNGVTPVYAYVDTIKYSKTNPYTAATTTATRTTTATTTRTAVVTTTARLGDVNDNGTVDIVDALMTAQYYVGLNPAGFVTANADVSKDGQITIVDALMIAQYYVGLIGGF